MESLSDSAIDLLARSLLLGPIAMTVLIIYVRAIGLRSYSKMTSFDFVSTVAIGSLLANAAVAVSWGSYLQSIIAIGSILFFQTILAIARKKNSRFRALISNSPVVLFSEGEFIESALNQTRVAKHDVWAKLREANALDPDSVHAVILETTGDISVLHGGNLDKTVLTGVSPKED